jgi:hypothetical protein
MQRNTKWLLSLVSFILNVIWYLNLVLIVTALCTLTIVYIKNDHTDISATVNYRSPVIMAIKAVTPDVSGVTISPQQAVIKMHARVTAGVILSSYLLFALFEVLVIGVIYNLRKVFASIHRKQPFEIENVKRLKITALCLVLFAPFNLLIDLLNYSMLNEQVPRFHEQYKITDTGNLIYIILGLVIYVLADVFAYGFQLKKENEEFV